MSVQPKKIAILRGIVLKKSNILVPKVNHAIVKSHNLRTPCSCSSLYLEKQLSHSKKYIFYISSSQEMARRNSLYRKIANTLEEEEGLSADHASNLAREAVRQGSKHGRPAGHNDNNSKPITLTDDACLGVEFECDTYSKFRTIDGKCNNLENPYWGAMSTAFLREIDVDEYDPLSQSVFLDEGEKLSGVPSGTYSRSMRQGPPPPNGGSSGGSSSTCPSRSSTLPSPRYVSHTFHTSENISATSVTHMLTQWGQFLDHDITLTPEEHIDDCCSAEADDDECFPIFVSSADSFYSLSGVNCLEFTRSVAYCEENGGARQQMNGITSFVDASNVYGSDDEIAASLRSNVDGKLLVDDSNFLPIIDDVQTAGDVRALEMPGLASMHTLFVREHNRLCDVIKSVEPSWDDETIYQNARRILIAEYQSITYGGYLPQVLGEKNLGKNKLSRSSDYVDNENPGMTNEFATASYRFGHSMIQGLIKTFFTDNSGQEGEYFLSENFFNIDTYLQYMDNIIMGLITQPAQAPDKEITSETTNLLFPEEGASFGTDLAARNIQRARDHGIPGFCCYYQLYDDPNHDCNEGWNRRYDDISQENWDLLQTIYETPNDIDLFTGALAQASYNGGLSGKVFMEMKSK